MVSYRILESSGDGWALKGEGEANIVFTYVGSEPSLIGTILRVPKVPKMHGQAQSNEWGFEAELWRGCFEWSADSQVRNSCYMRNFVAPFLGASYVNPGELVQLPPELLQNLKERGTVVDSSKPSMLQPDHTLFHKGATELGDLSGVGPCLCVEVKPKCGFLPTSSDIVPANSIKLTTPRFVLHQLHKHASGILSSLSHYNPLDLFSQEPKRVSRALHALIAQPSNNFRVFKDGGLVFGGKPPTQASEKAVQQVMVTDINALEAAVQPFIDSLERVNDPDDPRSANHPAISLLVRLLTETLSTTDVLPKLLAMQKLDTHDIEGIVGMYRHVKQAWEEGKRGSEVATYKGLDYDGQIAALRDYLAATTAKDCALMVTWQRVQLPPGCAPPAGLYQDPVSGCWARVKLSVIDLDLKTSNKIEKHALQDQELVNHAIQNKALLEQCIKAMES